MPDPYNRFSNSVLWPTLLIAFFLSLLLLIAMSLVDRNLKTNSAPRGIVSFELAGNLDKGQQILESWNTQGKMYAALSLGLDYLFLIVYAVFISLSCVRLARRLKSRLPYAATWGMVIGWAQFMAAMLDTIENYALIKLTFGYQHASWPLIARWCAMVKFGIVGVGLTYIVCGITIIRVLKLSKPELKIED